MKKIKPYQVPAKACTLSGGVFEFGDNGEGAKSFPVTIAARSTKAIEHWFWGKCVHDMAGMKLEKDRVPIDYCHDSKDIIGYANKHEITQDALMLSGALVPWKDSDRASEIVHKSKSGIPYEASINFEGDGIKFEEVREGEFAEANGTQYEGPCVIFREWPLRGVAVCPYGADQHTSSKFAADEHIVVTNLTEEMQEMSEATNEELTEQVEETEAETVDTETPDEAADGQAVDTETPDEVEAQEDHEFKASEFKSLVDKFGADIASKVVLSGGTEADAYRLQAEHNAKLAKKLEAEVETLRKQQGASAATFSENKTKGPVAVSRSRRTGE